MAQYGCVTITASENENIIPLIFKELTGNIPVSNKCRVQFIGFEAEKGTKIKLNNVPNQVPTTGKFITPYDGDSHMIITSLSFDSGCSDQNIYFIC